MQFYTRLDHRSAYPEDLADFASRFLEESGYPALTDEDIVSGGISSEGDEWHLWYLWDVESGRRIILLPASAAGITETTLDSHLTSRRAYEAAYKQASEFINSQPLPIANYLGALALHEQVKLRAKEVKDNLWQAAQALSQAYSYFDYNMSPLAVGHSGALEIETAKQKADVAESSLRAVLEEYEHVMARLDALAIHLRHFEIYGKPASEIAFSPAQHGKPSAQRHFGHSGYKLKDGKPQRYLRAALHLIQENGVSHYDSNKALWEEVHEAVNGSKADNDASNNIGRQIRTLLEKRAKDLGTATIPSSQQEWEALTVRFYDYYEQGKRKENNL